MSKVSSPTRTGTTARKKARPQPSPQKTGTVKKNSSMSQKANAQRQRPAEKSAISQEARDSKASKPHQVPNFQSSFGKGTASAKPASTSERSAGEDAARAAQQARVVAGQTNQHILRGSPGPTVGQGVRVVGGTGGVGSALLAGNNLKNALDSKRSAGDRVLQGAQGLGNAAHAVHGLSQGADFARARAGAPTLNNKPQNPVGLRQVPGHLAQNAREIGASGLRDTLQKGAKGLVTPAPAATGLDKASALGNVSRVAQTAGKVAPALGGAAQLAGGVTDAFRSGLNFDNATNTVSGGAKLVGAGLIASGVGAPVGAALIAGSTAFDLGKLAWDNRGALADAAKSAANTVSNGVGQAIGGLGAAGRLALSAIPGGGALLGGIGRLFG